MEKEEVNKKKPDKRKEMGKCVRANARERLLMNFSSSPSLLPRNSDFPILYSMPDFFLFFSGILNAAFPPLFCPIMEKVAYHLPFRAISFSKCGIKGVKHSF